jgi:hypothetical protein
MAAPPSPEAESAVALALAGRSPVRCGWCGEPFVGHPNRRYCSRPCENRADYARHAEARRAERRERYRRERGARPAGPLAPRPLSPPELAAIAWAPVTFLFVSRAGTLG